MIKELLTLPFILLGWLLLGAARKVVPEARYECPCGHFALGVPWRTDPRLVDYLLGLHFKECVVAQADVMVRQHSG